jgi:hypothetical protein
MRECTATGVGFLLKRRMLEKRERCFSMHTKKNEPGRLSGLMDILRCCHVLTTCRVQENPGLPLRNTPNTL